jgi:NADH-quinone oxidoreductase subunit L
VSLASEAPQLVDASSGLQSAAWLLVVLPVLSSAVLLLGGRRTDRWGHVLGTLVPIVLFVYTVLLFFQLQGLDPGERSRNLSLWSWIFAGDLRIDMGLLLDPLSITFALLITGVGSLILVYSNGYMEHDPDRRRFFAYMNLFIAAMLLLVLGNNFVVLYFGWEGVGLASYLLIAWYSDRPAAATAAKKAFIMNRVGDAGLIIAIFLMFKTFGTVSFAGVFGSIGNASVGIATALALLLLLGACGKSGQVPLQAWLPDAMEGPTPVSALIHAATMVTAGVYLIVRAHPIYDATEAGRTAVTVVGAVTLLFGCIVGCAYDDIKKVLAYSTVSQIGYMFLAVGLGPGVYAIGILHLLAHGFFKAGLFLGAGSVMHGMKDQVDMRRFGGLWRVMPITWVTMGLGYLAIIGFPFLSGFFTKDKIIEAAFDKGGTSGWILGLCALLGAGITAFYMTRLFIMTFHGKRRWTDDVHPHESPPVMTIPMIILAFGSVFGGGLLVAGGALQNWLIPSAGEPEEVGPAHGRTRPC